ncbi:MAG: hypothetical protein IJZ96_00115 [Lachnospiraceae bacterium]|nr:hypothetical protein [Lachnospiraceae bacterium]MBQ8319024.1 hypothetical protein [Lachnospiraceae bacterium]
MKYSAGYGLCKEDFTIEQVELATFVDENDAYQFIRMKFDNDIFNSKIYYVDAADGRHFMDTRHSEFVTDINKVCIWGYRVYAEFESRYEFDEDVDIETESCCCLSSKKIEELKADYYNQGASYVYIGDEEIDVADAFWNIHDFVKGRTDRINEELER